MSMAAGGRPSNEEGRSAATPSLGPAVQPAKTNAHRQPRQDLTSRPPAPTANDFYEKNAWVAELTVFGASASQI
jgi:hypothetical protein